MTEEQTGKKSKNPLVMVGIGCLVVIVLIGIVASVAMKFFAKTIGTNLIEKTIESKTGVKTDISDLEKGKMTFTDEKTGQKVDIGTTEIPETFPKDFPIYPGITVTSSISGAQSGKNNGFWITMSSTDAAAKITEFYTYSLGKNGWSVESTFSANGMTTQTVKKGTWNGTLSIGRSDSDTATQIVIMLGEETK